ncbi:MAG: LysR family transcriptional regulator [Pseudomonadales bacterium]|nr:LysR family transcriptional regulator [Pseudomonadales bacterium]
MKLQQLRYIWEVAHHDLNVSATAQSLFTSQPGISKQIRLLEDELDIEIFTRSGKHLTNVTPAGEAIIKLSGEILGQVANIKRIAQEYNKEERGELRIACTAQLNRDTLPGLIARFSVAYPEVVLSLYEGTPSEIEGWLIDGEVDLAISNEDIGFTPDVVRIPCASWQRALLLPKGHPLTEIEVVTLKALSEYPLITYSFDAPRGSDLTKAFKKQGHEANIVFTATDAQVIGNYVEQGIGIGIITAMPVEVANHGTLEVISLKSLLPACMTYICASKKLFLRTYMYAFIELTAPHLTQGVVERVFAKRGKAQIENSLMTAEINVQ